MQKILIVGATSAIAEACARTWAQGGAALFLLGRRLDCIEAIAADLRVRGAAEVGVAQLDVNDLDQHEPVIEQARAMLGGIDIALIAHGTLPDPEITLRSVESGMAEFKTNGSSSIALMTRLAAVLEAQRAGCLAVVSSVAGDRGRASNAIYGAAKAAVTAYASALRQRLTRSGVDVLTIKPGFVDTPMTAHIEEKGALWATPERIASGIIRAIERRRNVVYLPWFWRPIMTIIRLLPEFVFRRLRF